MNLLKRVSAACIPVITLLLSLYSPTAPAWGGSVDKYLVPPNEACASGFVRNENIYVRAWCLRISTLNEFMVGPDAKCPAGFARDASLSLRGFCHNLETTRSFIAQGNVACPEGFARNTSQSLTGTCWNLQYR